jgi:hypothetical protein
MKKHPLLALGLLFVSANLALAAGRYQPPQPQYQNQARSQTPVAPAQPQQQQVINLSLIEALVGIHQEGLAGLFGYIPEQYAQTALAEYLFRTPKDLKLYIKMNERDLKETSGINQWHKEVFLYMINIGSNPTMAHIDPLSSKLQDQVATLSLAQGFPLSEIAMRRKRR